MLGRPFRYVFIACLPFEGVAVLSKRHMLAALKQFIAIQLHIPSNAFEKQAPSKMRLPSIVSILMAIIASAIVLAL